MAERLGEVREQITDSNELHPRKEFLIPYTARGETPSTLANTQLIRFFPWV